MKQPPVKICPTKYADGYVDTAFDEFRIVGGRYCRPQSVDRYTQMAAVRACRTLEIMA